jgi:hypothetical protein
MTSNSVDIEELVSVDVERLQSVDPWFVRSGMFNELGKEVAAEVSSFFLNHPDSFAIGAVGMNTQKVANSYYRGDKKCWLTPKLCKERDLKATMQLIQKMIKFCKPASTSLKLNGDYSIQLACFVSDIMDLNARLSPYLLSIARGWYAICAT